MVALIIVTVILSLEKAYSNLKSIKKMVNINDKINIIDKAKGILVQGGGLQ